MRVLRLADQKVTAMDKAHFYVCQTDANMSYYLTKVVTDSERWTHDETLRLMYACLQDDYVDEVDSNDEDDKESVVEDDADGRSYKQRQKKVVRMVLMRMMIRLVHLQVMQLGQVVESYGK